MSAGTCREIERAVLRGLRTLEQPEPQRLSEWAAENFYLSAESSYIEGRWEAWPYQIAIMDCMSNDDIVSIDMMKSARTGYTKMLMAAIGYFAEHKRRNTVVFQPVDQDAQDFVKDEVDPMLRDCLAVQRVFPHYNTKSKYNTLSKKVFNGSTLDIRGGKAAKNYRRLTKDVVIYDELDGFDDDIEGEGDAVTLGDKRTEGATFPKSIRGSTPGDKVTSKIERGFREADQRFRYHVPCPHCEHMQPLRWGGKDVPSGIKWIGADASSAQYLCESCHALFTHADYCNYCLPRGRWTSEDGIWIDHDGYFRAENGDIIPAPERVAFHIWTAYSPQTDWRKIVGEFIRAQRDLSKSKLKTFVNTTLGETWEDDVGERTDADLLAKRAESYAGVVPDGVVAIVAGIDSQDDRFEIQFDGYGAGEERWSLSFRRIYGDLSRQVVWDKLAAELRRTFKKADGTVMQVVIAAQDHGGHYGDEVNTFSKRMGVRFLIPIKGSSVAGKPVALMPRKRNANGVYLTMVGTDTAKSLLHQRYKILEDGPGYVHWPKSEEFDSTYFAQVTAEEQIRKMVGGRRIITWDSKGRRNEATDCSVYSLAAIRVAQQHFGLKLISPDTTDATPVAQKRTRRVARSSYLRN